MANKKKGPLSDKITQLIATQLPAGDSKWAEPVFHYIEPDYISTIGRILANATGKTVRITRPENEDPEEVKRLSGNYFGPQDGMTSRRLS